MFLLIRETRRQLKTFSTVKPIPEVFLFRTQSNIYDKGFLWFSQKIFTTDVRLVSKYATAYIYMQVSPIEIMCTLDIFALKYIFSYKRRMNKSSSQEIS